MRVRLFGMGREPGQREGALQGAPRPPGGQCGLGRLLVPSQPHGAPAPGPGARLFRNQGPPEACTLSPGSCHILACLSLRRDRVRAWPCPLAGHHAGGEAWGSGHPAPPDDLGDMGGCWVPGRAMSAPRALQGLLGEGPGGCKWAGPLGCRSVSDGGTHRPWWRGGAGKTAPTPTRGRAGAPGLREGFSGLEEACPPSGGLLSVPPGAGPWRGWGCLMGLPPLLGGARGAWRSPGAQEWPEGAHPASQEPGVPARAHARLRFPPFTFLSRGLWTCLGPKPWSQGLPRGEVGGGEPHPSRP